MKESHMYYAEQKMRDTNREYTHMLYDFTYKKF